MSDQQVLVLFTSADMANLYRCPNASAFMRRYYVDRLRPREVRTIPDPINHRHGKGTRALWNPDHVRDALSGGPVWVRS